MRRLLVLTTTAVLIAGCSQSGHAEKAPGPPASITVDVTMLGSGNFPVKPSPALGVAGSASHGALIDARRMADDVVGPWEVDPALVIAGTARAMVLPDAAALADILPPAVADVAKPMIYGFASDRRGAGQARLMNAVLRFADPAAAAAAAAGMADSACAVTPTVDRPVPIPAHPSTHATTFTYDLDTDGPPPSTVYAFTAHGPYVLVQLAHSDTLGGAVGWVSGLLDRQGPRIDGFAPTDPEHFSELAVDPSGLLAHTMSAPTYPDPPSAKPFDPQIGVYLPRAALHFQDSPIDAGAAFVAAGLSEMTFNQTIVYRTRDAAAATDLVRDLTTIALRSEPSAQPLNAVDFLPSSQCVQSRRTATDSVSYCFAALDSRVIAVHDADPTGARQETAAQYKMLLAG